MYLTNPPARDALVSLTFRNTRFESVTIHVTLSISDPAGLTLGSILSIGTRGTFFLVRGSGRSRNFEGAVGDFIEEQEKKLGGSFELHLSDDKFWDNPKIGLTDGTELWVSAKRGLPHHVMVPPDPCVLKC